MVKIHDEQFVEDLGFYHLELITITRFNELFEDKLHFFIQESYVLLSCILSKISFLLVKKLYTYYVSRPKSQMKGFFFQ